MIAEDAVYDAAFQRAGIARVFEIGDIFDCAELVGRPKTAMGPRLAIVTNAGGPGVMATDALIACNGVLAKLNDETLASLNESLPPFWSHRNPIDVLGDARSKRIAKAAQTVLRDPGVDAVLVILTPQAMTNPTPTAAEIVQLSQGTSKPILAAWLGGQSMRDGIRTLNDAGIPTYTTPEQAVRAFMTLVQYARNLESLHETPKDIPVQFPIDRGKIHSQFDSIIRREGEVLLESTSKMLIEAYGIPAVHPHAARTDVDGSAGQLLAGIDLYALPVFLPMANARGGDAVLL